MKVLFVCQANLNRSPRAAEVFQELAGQKGFAAEVQSAGTGVKEYFGNFTPDPQLLSACFGVNTVTQLTREMLEKADIVVALDNSVGQEIANYRVCPKRMIVLGIPDHFSLRRGNLEELKEMLKEKLEPLAKELSLLEGKLPGKEIL